MITNMRPLSWLLVAALSIGCGDESKKADTGDEPANGEVRPIGGGQGGSDGSPQGNPDPTPNPTPNPEPEVDPLGPPVPTPYARSCQRPCASTADCPTIRPDGAHAPERYACEDGACRYLGCLGDEGCKLSYNDQYACKPPTDGGSPFRCRVPCATRSDCNPRGPLDLDIHVDDDNWSCSDGACLYAGCKSDEECRTGRGPDFVCRNVLGGVPQCFETCDVATDCGGADLLFDADNHTCDAGLCLYTGCTTDEECQAYYDDSLVPLLCR